ncbi:hypothetical protein DIPPA_12577 [Diplonema papillatum]|nr:hypothetical protein DIPPA_12577 [Diplonema papillatum]
MDVGAEQDLGTTDVLCVGSVAVGHAWTENGQVPMLELAIDFELFSGLSMPLHGNAPKGVRERGNVLRCMMSALDKLAAATTGNASWKASGASAARGNEKGDGDDRTGDQKAATNVRNQRTTSAEEKGARHPEGRPDRRPQAEEDEGDHPRLRGASKEEEGTEGRQLSETTGDHGHTNALESEKRTHVPALVLADSVSGIARKPNPASSTNARP